jgi:polysaccharide deacetylase 2 family uncharacterized protein YibQ
MTGFQKQLDEELEKRGLRDEDAAPLAKLSKFSFKTFLIGLILSTLLIGGLVAWAMFSADKTQQHVSGRLPSKTAVVDVVSFKTYRISDSQPTLNMPSDVTSEAIAPMNEHGSPAPKISKEEHAITQMIETNESHHESANKEEHAPQISSSTSPFKAYRQSFVKSSKPVLSIIITDLGLSTKRTEQIIKDFPKEVSIAFSPYSENLDMLTTTAREDGHETWLMLPMQTKDYPLVDSGPLTLLIGARVEQNNDRLQQLISNAQGQVGFIPNKNHIFKIEDSNINPAIKTLLNEGFAILDSNTSDRSFISSLAYKNDYPYGQNNFWLDDNLSPIALNQRIRQMMELAEATGSVTMMLRPYPASIKALQKFLNSAAVNKFQLAPASALLKNSG